MERKLSYFVLLALCVFTLILMYFANLLYFRGDDLTIIKASISNHFPITQTWLESEQQYFRPLTVLFFYIQFLYNDLNPLNYYYLNIILHIINTILLLKVLSYFKTLLCLKNIHIVLSVALLFMINFISIGNVFWISEQHDLWVLFFILTSINIIVFPFRKKSKTILYFIVCLISGYMIKESFIVVIFYVLMFEYIIMNFIGPKLNLRKGYLFSKVTFVITTLYLMYRIFFLNLGFQSIPHINNVVDNIFVVKYLIYGLSSTILSTDILDILYLRYFDFYIFSFRVAVYCCILVFVIILYNKSNFNIKYLSTLFLVSGFLSMFIYIRLFVAPRLLYIILPFFYISLYLICSTKKKLSLSLLFLFLLMINNAVSLNSEINKIIIANNYTKQFIKAFPKENIDKINLKYIDLTNIHRISQFFSLADKSLLLSANYKNNLYFRNIEFISPFMIETYPYENIDDVYKCTVELHLINVEIVDGISVINPPPKANYYKYSDISSEIFIDDGIQVKTIENSIIRKGYASKIQIIIPENYQLNNLYIIFFKNNKIAVEKYDDFVEIYKAK